MSSGQTFSHVGVERICISMQHISYNLRYLFKTIFKDVMAGS